MKWYKFLWEDIIINVVIMPLAIVMGYRMIKDEIYNGHIHNEHYLRAFFCCPIRFITEKGK